ncbi:DNA polymerase III subunit gamma/tau C-terminal domain-containing protein [Acidovorax carolinensis]|uniref:DNA polymerase III subunit gamma/tau C-terminal domain-containing protein n=1 Tax=Acidovorax carolinensis TaxID=553814 RepID=UPI003AABC7C2
MALAALQPRRAACARRAPTSTVAVSRLHRTRCGLEPWRGRGAEPAGAGGVQAGAGALQGLHDRRSAHAHEHGVQRHAQDAGRAARIPQVRAGHDRPAKGAGHRSFPLPAVQPAPHGARDRAQPPHAGARGRERFGRTPGPAPAVARGAGSMRDALSLTDQAIAFGSGQLQEAAVRQMLGAVDRSYVFRLIDALAQGDGKTVVETSDTLRLNGLSAASTLEEMSAVLQRMAVFQAVPQMAGAVDADDPEAFETARLAALMPADETQLLYSLCLHGRGELGLAPDEYAALTMVLLRLLAFKPPVDPAEKKTLTRPEAPPGAAEPGPRAAAAGVAPVAPSPSQAQPQDRLTQPVYEQNKALAPVLQAQSATYSIAEPVAQPVVQSPQAPAAAAAMPTAIALPVRGGNGFEQKEPAAPLQHAQSAPEFVAIPVRMAPEPGARLQPHAHSTPVPASARYTPTEEGDVWHGTVQQLVAAEAITALVRELALQSQLVARDGGHWLLRVERESLNQPQARERLRAALEAAGHASQISVELGVVIDSPARRNAAAAAERQRVAEDIVMNDPYVQSLMRDFGAKIVPGSIKPA